MLQARAPPVLLASLDFIYGRFFKAGVVSVLSAGCLCRRINLFETGLRGLATLMECPATRLLTGGAECLILFHR
jgi:hypothetical protein